MSSPKDNDLLDPTDEELAGGSPVERNWRGIVISLVVIFTIMMIVLSVIVLFTPLSGTSLDLTSGVSLSAVVGGALFPPVEFFRWQDSSSFVFSTQRHLYQRATLSSPQQAETFLDGAGLSDSGQIIRSSFSADFTFLAIARTAGTEDPANKTFFYEIFNRNTLETVKVGPKKTGREALQTFEWASSGNHFAFVYNDQVFFSASPDTVDAVRVSEEDGRRHGVFDWVYEEEIFDSATALWWSPSGSVLAFASTDDRAVRKGRFPLYKRNEAYPKDIEFSYPMTEEKRLPTVTLSLWNKDSRELRQLDVLLRDSVAFHYLIAVSWVRLHKKEQLVAVWSNRLQNEISVTICEFNTSICTLSYEYKYEHGSTHMWATPSDFHPVLHSDSELFFLLPQATPDGGIFQHIARLLVPENYVNAKRSSLSSGSYDVAELLAYDRNTNSVIFLANAPLPSQRHIFSTSATPSLAGDSSRCVSCVSSECTYQRAEVSPSGRHALVQCAGPLLQKLLLVDLVTQANGTIMAEIGANEEYATRWKAKTWPTVIYDQIMLSHGSNASIKIQVPGDGTLRTTPKAFPVVVYVYGGPGSQTVTEKFEVNYHTYLVTTLGYAVVSIDGRGSGGRGWKLKSAIYGKLGTVEVADQLEALRALLDKYIILDRHRVAIWGWSYGGFVSANAVIEDSLRTLKCAVSVAPVSNFKYYDATYTERYMGDAPTRAYEASSLTRNVSNFAHTKLLLAHGIADDNVHFVNTALFLQELQKNTIPFELMIYPNSDHNLGPVRRHLYGAMDRFLHSCFSS